MFGVSCLATGSEDEFELFTPEGLVGNWFLKLLVRRPTITGGGVNRVFFIINSLNLKLSSNLKLSYIREGLHSELCAVSCSS